MTLATVLALVATAVAPAADASVARRVAPYDFDRDGRQDLAIGLPRYQPAGAPDAGAVVILPGGRRGPSAHRRLISRRTAGVPGVPTGDDGFGQALASADFDGDRYADLAVSVPGDRAVYVLYGSPHGLTGIGVTRIALGLDQPPPEFFSPIEAVLVAGNLDGDRYGDLVIGPRTLSVHLGARSGLSERPVRTIDGPKGARRGFGSVLALGDINRDGRVDVVEASPGDPFFLDDPPIPGHVTFCRGRPAGPRACRRIAGNRPGPASLAVADVTGDRYPDIVEGVPVARFYTQDGGTPPGALRIVRGGPRGPGRALTITPASPGVPGHRHRYDEFGATVAATDLDRDGFADIVAGGAGDLRYRGRLTMIRGGPAGYARTGNALVDEATPGVPGTRRRERIFGASASALDTRGDGSADLAVGVPGSGSIERGYGSLTVLMNPRPGARRLDGRSFTLRRLRLRAPEAPSPFIQAAPFGAVLGRPAASSSTGNVFF